MAAWQDELDLLEEAGANPSQLPNYRKDRDGRVNAYRAAVALAIQPMAHLVAP